VLLFRFARLTLQDKKILIRALSALVWTRAELSLRPFSGVWQASQKRSASVFRSAPEAARVAWAFEAVGRRVPVLSNCLVQALAASRILKKYGYAPVVELGAVKKNGSELAAHAWLTIDGRVLLGTVEERFTSFNRTAVQ
jgi:hypothetical protein